MTTFQRNPDHIVSTGDVARLLGCAPRTASKLMDAGHIESWRLPGTKGDRRTSHAMLLEFAAKHGIPLDEIQINRATQLDAFGLPKPRGLRSGKWHTLEKAHLSNHPACEACGTRKLVVVHHKLPFHVYPELELEWTNFISLCESATHNCHLIFGHLLSWKSWNVNVVVDVTRYRDELANRPDHNSPPPAAHAALDEAETRRAA